MHRRCAASRRQQRRTRRCNKVIDSRNGEFCRETFLYPLHYSFYDKVSIVQAAETSADGRPLYEICLDKRKLRTPARKVLQVQLIGKVSNKASVADLKRALGTDGGAGVARTGECYSNGPHALDWTVVHCAGQSAQSDQRTSCRQSYRALANGHAFLLGL